MKVHGDQSC